MANMEIENPSPIIKLKVLFYTTNYSNSAEDETKQIDKVNKCLT